MSDIVSKPGEKKVPISRIEQRTGRTFSAAQLFLMKFTSQHSVRSMKTSLNRAAIAIKPELKHAKRDMGQEPWTVFDWIAVDRDMMFLVKSALFQQGKSPATVNSTLSAIKGVMKEAFLVGQIDGDTYQRVRMVEGQKKDGRPAGRSLGMWEVKTLLNVCKSDDNILDIRNRCIVACLYGLGMRRSEIVTLELSSVSKSAEVTIKGKRNKVRELPLPDWALPILDDWLEVRGDHHGPLFYRFTPRRTMTREPISTNQVYNLLSDLAKKAGIDHISPHDMRRTFATQLFDAGVDLADVGEAMGHEDLNTTKIYVRDRSERAKRMLKKLPSPEPE